MSINVLIIEDENKIVDVIEAYLKKDGFNTVISNNGKDALEKFREHAPDIIILDLMLPDISGEELCEIIKSESNTPIIMLTAKSQEVDILNGFSLGCDDYVVKPFRPKELVARVNSVLKRTMNIDESKTLSFNNGELKIRLDKMQVIKDSKLVTVTQSEFKILATLARNPQIVFTRDQLLNKIKDESEAFDRVIDTHIKNLRYKIETDNKNPSYIQTVYGIGYKFGGIW